MQSPIAKGRRGRKWQREVSMSSSFLRTLQLRVPSLHHKRIQFSKSRDFKFSLMTLSYLPMIAVTKCYRLSGLKTVEMCSLTTSPKSRCWDCYQDCLLVITGIPWLWLHHSYLCLHGPCPLSVSKFPFSNKNTGHVGFKTHPNVIWSHLTFIISTNVLFTNKLTFTGFG